LGIAPTIDNALAIIQQEERDVMSRADDTSEINLSYSFTKHRTAVGLARMCGWQSPFDILYKSPVEIHVTAGEYWRKMPQICEEYNVRLPSQQIVATLDVPSAVTAMMKPVSTILYSIYGISVICEKTVWRLKPHPAFKIVGPPGDQTVTLSPD
jgi:hypothetical protein